MGELQTIVDSSMGACGGGSGACISPVFGPTAETPVEGPCPHTAYWSSTYLGSPSGFTLGVDFMVGMVGAYNVGCNLSARAVRGGP